MLEQPHTLTLLGDAMLEERQVVLAGGVLDVGDQPGALAHQVIAPAPG